MNDRSVTLSENAVNHIELNENSKKQISRLQPQQASSCCYQYIPIVPNDPDYNNILINRLTLVFKNISYEEFFREESFAPQAHIVIKFFIFILILLSVSIAYDYYFYFETVIFIPQIILRCVGILFMLVPLCLTFYRSYFIYNLQSITLIPVIIVGISISVTTVLPNMAMENRTSSSTIIAFVVLVHASCPILFRYLFPSSWLVVAVFIVSAFVFESKSEDPLTAIVQCLFLITANVFLLSGSYNMEMFRRRSIIQRRIAQMRAARLQADNMDMRQEMFRMVMEDLDCIDKTTSLDTRSPMEKALELLKEITQDKNITQLHSVSLKVKNVITYLSDANQLLRPNIVKQFQDGKGSNIDISTQQWLLYLMEETVMDIPHTSSIHVQDGTNPLIIPDGLGDKAFISAYQTLDTWNYDIFEINQKTNGTPLQFVALALFKRYHFFTLFNIDQTKLKNFLNIIEDGYLPNPYHNKIHAADVTQTTHFFLHTCEMYKYLNDIELMGAILSSVVHDLDHPGQNNAFHVATKHQLSLVYNDKTILENHHVSQAFIQLLKTENFFLEGLSPTQYSELRKIMIEMVIATDLFLHFDLLTNFKTFSTKEFDIKNKQQRTLILQMVIKCADVSHSCKAIDTHLKWTSRIVEEFYRQGDEERKRDLPISPFMDRLKPNVPKSQIGFMNFLVVPMFEAFTKWVDLPCDAFPCFDCLKKNLDYWKEQESKQVLSIKEYNN